MPMLEIDELGENGKAIQKGRGGAKKKVCCYEFRFSCQCANRIIVMMNHIREWFAMLWHSYEDLLIPAQNQINACAVVLSC